MSWDAATQRRWPDEEVCRWVQRAKLPRYARTLEIGCGNGRNFAPLKAKNLEVYGVDAHEGATDLAGALAGAQVVMAAQVPPIPFDDGFFSAVLDVQCLQHADRMMLEATLREVARVLGPQGVFFSEYLIDVDAGIFPACPELLEAWRVDYGLQVQRAGFEVTRAERVTRTYEGGTKEATWLILDARKTA